MAHMLQQEWEELIACFILLGEAAFISHWFTAFSVPICDSLFRSSTFV
jgi:hypothetical protein